MFAIQEKLTALIASRSSLHRPFIPRGSLYVHFHLSCKAPIILQNPVLRFADSTVVLFLPARLTVLLHEC